MAEAEQRLARADVAEGLAMVAAERQRREHQYPLPLFVLGFDAENKKIPLTHSP
jgi:hypothetical protein